ncbi:MAG: fimbrillin family protein [Alistipes sp.]|nr:fimbrillin family protein [Alistipes senegalensis]MCM1250479.1 fimbrillin family protein [Alistipes sp.]
MLCESKRCRCGMLAALVLLSLSGCAKHDTGNSYVTILPTIRTRVSGLGFEAGDRIGLTILRAAETYAENRPMTYDGTAFSGDLQWYAAQQEASTLIAYYPYSETGAPDRFSVSTDQRSGCASSDLLGAVKTEVVPGAAPVSMVFDHLMAQLSVVVTNRTANPVVGVVLGGSVPRAEVDFAAQRVVAAADEPAADVRACEVQAGLSYRAVLVPQNTDLTLTLTAADGAVLTKTIHDATLRSGCRYDVEVEWTGGGDGILMVGGISDWNEGGTIVPGDEGDDGEPETPGGSDDSATGGNAGTLNYGGEAYRTQRIGELEWMAENLRYIPGNATLGDGVRYPEAGESAVAEKGLLYDLETALAGSAADAGTPVRGICPAGWHLPSWTELETLIGCEAAFFCDAGCWIWSARECKYGANSYLMSSTLSDQSTKMVCLCNSTNYTRLESRCCVSVRCVKDE